MLYSRIRSPIFNFRCPTGAPTLSPFLVSNAADLPNRPGHPSACVVRPVGSTAAKSCEKQARVHGCTKSDWKRGPTLRFRMIFGRDQNEIIKTDILQPFTILSNVRRLTNDFHFSIFDSTGWRNFQGQRWCLHPEQTRFPPRRRFHIALRRRSKLFTIPQTYSPRQSQGVRALFLQPDIFHSN